MATDEKKITMSEADFTAAIEAASTRAADQVLLTLQRNQTPEAFRGINFIGQTGFSNEANEQARHISDFFRAVVRKDQASALRLYEANKQWYPAARAAFSEAANGEGLYTVPTTWSTMIMSNVERFGFARKLGNVQPMGSKDVNFTTGGGVIVSWPGANTAPTPQNAASFYAQTKLSAETMAAAYIMQKELAEDSIVDQVGYLAQVFGVAVAKEEDVQFFNGTGSPFTGLIGTSGVLTSLMTTGKTAFSNVSWTDMNNLKLATNSNIQSSGVYVVPQTVLGYLFNEKDSQNRPIRNISTSASPEGLPQIGIDAAPYTYNNSPMYVVPDDLFPASAVSKACAIFGDIKTYGILGVRRELTMDTFTEQYAGVDLAGKRQIATQLTERVGVAFPVPTAFALLKTAGS